MKYCFRHKDRPAVAKCQACLKPICEECVVIHNNLKFCSSGCAEKYEKFVSKKREFSRLSAKIKFKNFVRKWIKRIIFLLILCTIIYFIWKNGWITL